MNSNTKWLYNVAFGLVVFGSIDHLLFGIVPASDETGEGFSLIQALFGFNPDVLNIFYILVGVSGVYLLVRYFKDAKGGESRKAKEA